MKVQVTKKKQTKKVHQKDHLHISIFAQTLHDCKQLKCDKIGECDNIGKFRFFKKPFLKRECKRYFVRGE